MAIRETVLPKIRAFPKIFARTLHDHVEARFKTKLAISEIVAGLDPQPDVPTTIMPVPEFAVLPQPPAGPAPTAETPGSRKRAGN